MNDVTFVERLDPYDIPLRVWLRVWLKWNKALKTGWHGGLWDKCRLCIYLKLNHGHGVIDPCNICPLPPTGYCTCNSGESKISMHYKLRDPRISPRVSWICYVEDFLVQVKQWMNLKIRIQRRFNNDT